MTYRLEGLPSFTTAFIAAPLAAAPFVYVAALVLLAITGLGHVGILLSAAALFAAYAVGISYVFTALVGAIVVVYVRRTGRRPRLRTAITVGILVGVTPWLFLAYASLKGPMALPFLEAMASPLIALIAGASTGSAFWYLGLRVPPPRL